VLGACGKVFGAREEIAERTSSSALRRSVRRVCRLVMERVEERERLVRSSFRELAECSRVTSARLISLASVFRGLSGTAW